MTLQTRSDNKRVIGFAGGPDTDASGPHRRCGSGPIHLDGLAN